MHLDAVREGRVPHTACLCGDDCECHPKTTLGAAAIVYGTDTAVQMFKTEAQKRKDAPACSGCVDYFPDAITAVGRLSKIGNDQHNPGKPLHWDRSKSGDEADALMRHLIDRKKNPIDTDGVPHVVKCAWRALALAQKYLEDNPWQ